MSAANAEPEDHDAAGDARVQVARGQVTVSRALGWRRAASIDSTELDESIVHLKAGDVIVQRGTIHKWVNRGSAPCVLAVVLIDAKPVEVGGKVLHAVG